MIKKLDILVLRSFTGPFIATFFLTLFVLILQFFWLWIDDFVGKGIDTVTMLQLVVYLSATLVPLALPLAVLLSSIMTFGNLGETFELVAIKSAGLGLLRFMRPLLVVALLLSGLAFLFNNYVIPVANLKMKTLHTDLVNKKPAFDLKEGVFYTTIPDYAIKVAKKQNDSLLSDVIIYEYESGGLQDNIIVAREGIMRISDNKQFLEFILKDGWRYQERGQRYNPENTEFIRLGFKEYKKVLDLSALQLNRTADSIYKDRYEMLSVSQLGKAIDSLEKMRSRYEERMRTNLQVYLSFTKYLDTGWVDVPPPPANKAPDTAGIKKANPSTVKKPDSFATKVRDTVAKKIPAATVSKTRDTLLAKTKTFRDLLPDSARVGVGDQSISYANSIKSSLEGTAAEYENRRKDLRLHLIVWHEKFTMSIAVLVLFLIGAPLGSIVRKGGIGTPVVFAVIFFVIFFLLNNFGKKFVKEDVLQPLAGMWLATFVLVPIGMFLIYKALHDSQLFNKEYYYRFFRKMRALFAKKARHKVQGTRGPAD